MGVTLIKRSGRTALSLLFPNVCPLCDRVMPLSEEGRLCDKCIGKTVPLTGDTCLKCGKPLPLPDSEYCEGCRRRTFSFKRNFMLFLYENEVRELMIKLKYKNRKDIAFFLAEEAFKKFGENFKKLEFDAVIPVPVHKTRYKMRGYNQAAAIASELADRLKLPCFPDVLERAKQTTAQKRLDSLARMKNLREAFSVNPAEFERMERKSGKLRVLLVDDILTTGSTLECAAEKLLEHGVFEVYGFTVCGTRGE